MKKFTLCSLAVFCILPAAAFGQTPAPQSSAPVFFETTPIPTSERLDYRLEFNNVFNNTDLDNAETFHYSDKQIARIYKIAKLSHVSFAEILSQVRDGKTFITIADELNIPQSELWNVSHEQDEIDAYEEAYAATGNAGVPRHNRVISSDDAARRGS